MSGPWDVEAFVAACTVRFPHLVRIVSTPIPVPIEEALETKACGGNFTDSWVLFASVMQLTAHEEKARSPTGLLTVQIGKMECGQFVGKIKPDKDVERMARDLVWPCLSLPLWGPFGCPFWVFVVSPPGVPWQSMGSCIQEKVQVQ